MFKIYVHYLYKLREKNYFAISNRVELLSIPPSFQYIIFLYSNTLLYCLSNLMSRTYVTYIPRPLIFNWITKKTYIKPPPFGLHYISNFMSRTSVTDIPRAIIWKWINNIHKVYLIKFTSQYFQNTLCSYFSYSFLNIFWQ